MIIQNKLGVLAEGDISRDPEIKTVGSRAVYKISLRVKNEKREDGTWDTQYVQVDIWDHINEWDGMLQKGDHIFVVGSRLESREYNGKTYYSIKQPIVYPEGMVIFHWMQMQADMIMQDMQPAPQMIQTSEQTPFDAPEPEPQQISMENAMYPGENLSDYAPRSKTAEDQDRDTRLIETDAEDLPF